MRARAPALVVIAACASRAPRQHTRVEAGAFNHHRPLPRFLFPLRRPAGGCQGDGRRQAAAQRVSVAARAAARPAARDDRVARVALHHRGAASCQTLAVFVPAHGGLASCRRPLPNPGPLPGLRAAQPCRVQLTPPLPFPNTHTHPPPIPQVPAEIIKIVAVLMSTAGISDVRAGRQAEEKSTVSQDLELYLTKQDLAGGFTLVARSGRVLQELIIDTSLSRDDMKKAVRKARLGGGCMCMLRARARVCHVHAAQACIPTATTTLPNSLSLRLPSSHFASPAADARAEPRALSNPCDCRRPQTWLPSGAANGGGAHPRGLH